MISEHEAQTASALVEKAAAFIAAFVFIDGLGVDGLRQLPANPR